MFHFLYKGGRKNLAKLVRKPITDSMGRHTHVWVSINKDADIRVKHERVEVKGEGKKNLSTVIERKTPKHGKAEKALIKVMNNYIKSLKKDKQKLNFPVTSEDGRSHEAQLVNEASQYLLALHMGFNPKSKQNKVFNTNNSHPVDMILPDAMIEIKTKVSSSRTTIKEGKADSKKDLSFREKGSLYQQKYEEVVGKFKPLYLVGIDVSEFLDSARGYKVVSSSTDYKPEGKGSKYVKNKETGKWHRIEQWPKGKKPRIKFYIHETLEKDIHMAAPSKPYTRGGTKPEYPKILHEIDAHTFKEAAATIQAFTKETYKDNVKQQKKNVKKDVLSAKRKRKASAATGKNIIHLQNNYPFKWEGQDGVKAKGSIYNWDAILGPSAKLKKGEDDGVLS